MMPNQTNFPYTCVVNRLLMSERCNLLGWNWLLCHAGYDVYQDTQ